jgi:hypothetical protein
MRRGRWVNLCMGWREPELHGLREELRYCKIRGQHEVMF